MLKRKAPLVVHGDDDNFIKLVNPSIYETRQTEFIKEINPVDPGYLRSFGTLSRTRVSTV